MSKQSAPLYLGTNRFVAALNPRTGEEIWRTRLPHTGSAIVTLLSTPAYIYAGHAGHVYSLDKRLGTILWENDLPKMGYGPVMLAIDPQPNSRLNLLYIGTSRFVAALAPNTGEQRWRSKLPHAGSAIVSLLVGKVYLFVGHAGYLYSLDKRLGSILWENGLPRMGYHTVLTTMDGASGSSPAAVAAGQRAEQQQRTAAAASCSSTGS